MAFLLLACLLVRWDNPERKIHLGATSRSVLLLSTLVPDSRTRTATPIPVGHKELEPARPYRLVFVVPGPLQNPGVWLLTNATGFL